MAERVFSQIIRAVREKHEISQHELGVRCGVKKSAAQVQVSDWESGHHALSERTMERVAAALGMSTRELLKVGLALLDERRS